MNALGKYAPTVSRILLGLIFFVFGLNGFLNFIPMDEPPPQPAADFVGALMATGYVYPLVKGIEVVAGAMLLANRFVPLSLVLLAPIVVNIIGFHLVLAPGAYGMLVLLLATGLHLAYVHRATLGPLLRPRPGSAQDGTPAHDGVAQRSQAPT